MPLKKPTSAPEATITAMIVQKRRRRAASRRSPSPGSMIDFTIIENLLDRQAEDPREFECERERGIVLAGFDGVHRLTGHAQATAKFCLAPPEFRPKYPETIVHSAV